MLIEIHELEQHPIEFDEKFLPGRIDLGADLRQRGPLEAKGRAQLVEEHHGKHKLIRDIRLKGELSASLEIACARCLAPVVQDVEREFELLYRPQGADAGQEELSFSGAEAEIGYYQGAGLLLEEALREQVLLAVPLKAICREDCKGLCPQCGADLNLAPCSCPVAVGNPRWSALKEFRSKLED
ncbi:MAG TPA: DUF177 domain-containing protein [Terriglobales bacterium]|nr:DUF177 domain-containing protein [Terriglobales bacterium]